jgi:hypothetical protein
VGFHVAIIIFVPLAYETTYTTLVCNILLMNQCQVLLQACGIRCHMSAEVTPNSIFWHIPCNITYMLARALAIAVTLRE